jgi:GntR family transcriptional regulator
MARATEAQGLDEHSKVLATDIRPAGDAGERLGLSPHDEVVYVERLRFAGPDPLALDRPWLPASMPDGRLYVDLSQGSLYDALHDRCGLQVTSGWERITPTIASPPERAALQLPTRRAVFAVERLTRGGAQLIEWRHSLVRGDRYRFVSQWP